METISKFPEISAEENILWIGKPKFVPFFFHGLGIDIFSIVVSLIFYWIVTLSEKTEPAFSLTMQRIFMIMLFFAIYRFLQRILSYHNTHYVLTDRRIMFRSGFLTITAKYINYGNIISKKITVDFINKMYETGTIRFFSGETIHGDSTEWEQYDYYIGIENPCAIFRMIDDASPQCPKFTH